ncbi:uncharacterized protein [Pleurodeles waltl]|uniref:uncharacterized protein isoform X2 n=1 Tax=Pleurodeles waltl TaxID=8319 RepID=UPI0037097EC4
MSERGVAQTEGEVFRRGVAQTKGEVTKRWVTEERVVADLGLEESDIDKEKHLIKLKNESETTQWKVGFNLLTVAVLEVGKALWDRECPLEDRAQLWETLQQWVLNQLLTREQPSEEDCTWLKEELDPGEQDPSAQDHLWCELSSLFRALKDLLTSTATLSNLAPSWKGPRLLPLLRPGLRWASYTSFTAQEREDHRRLYQLLGEVSEKLSARALGDLSTLTNELKQLTDQCHEQTTEVEDRARWTLARKRPDLRRDETRLHIPPEGDRLLPTRTSESGHQSNARFWPRIAMALTLIYLITIAVIIFNSLSGPSAVILRNYNGCYRTDWTPSMNKYFWNKEETDWDTSSRLCQEKNGTLAVLHDESQVIELLEEYGRRYPWIGLHKLEEEFQWVDGTSWNSTVFPLNGYGDCVYLRKDVFSVNECSMRRSSLCRRKPCD